MGNPTAGHQGATITFASGYVLHAYNFNYDRNVTPIEVTEFGDTERTRIAGLGDSSGTFNCMADDATVIPALPMSGTATFTRHNSGGNLRKVDIIIMVHSYSVAVNIDGRVELTFTFSQAGTGASTDFIEA